MAQWYMRVLGLIPTDVQYLEDGSPTSRSCRLDLGDTPADHHAVVVVGGIDDRLRAQRLRGASTSTRWGRASRCCARRGHRHLWGIGRHVIGSQLFDYWFDPDGLELGALHRRRRVHRATYETRYSPLDFGGICAPGAPTRRPR